ncbi:MAG: 50S ribosomal protein L11 methyltransferase [Tannerellaceae bacterium]|jgi:ribosomal protein L11 methyltransferase|nr:50S ribosomal protein L11 methyltransferase [Tannerellaceae bacterium]
MNYYEYTFTYAATFEPDIINAVLSAVLGGAGFESFMETAEGLQGYIPEKEHDAERLEAALASFPLEDVAVCFTKRYIEATDWNEEWEKNYFRPIEIGTECVVHASFHQVKAGYTYDITIHPKMAFGTGNHETTYLMLLEMLRSDVSDKAVLDMGCGTAILAILAAMKGASPVVAIDIDEWAYNNALENKCLNHTGDIQVIRGGAEQLPAAETFDFVFANINRNILLNDIRHYAPCMKPGATLFMSGFYTEDIPAIQEECSKNGLTCLSSSEKNRWVTVKAEKTI